MEELQQERTPTNDDLVKNLEFIIQASKDEISAQADVFNQLDNKTGVVIGFALVAVAQVFAALLRVISDKTSLPTVAPTALGMLFLAGGTLVLLATIFGAVERRPRHFAYGISFDPQEEKHPAMKVKMSALKAYREAIMDNDTVNKDKANWAAWTSHFVAGALACLVLAMFILFFSIPSNATAPLATSAQASTASTADTISDSVSFGIIQQIFTIFFAIFWGTAANAQPRWKAFALGAFFRDRFTRRRFALSLLILNALPLGVYVGGLLFFSHAKWSLTHWGTSSILRVFPAVAAGFSVFGFYRLWTGIVQRFPNTFYGPENNEFRAMLGAHDLSPVWSAPNIIWGLLYIVAALAIPAAIYRFI